MNIQEEKNGKNKKDDAVSKEDETKMNNNASVDEVIDEDEAIDSPPAGEVTAEQSDDDDSGDPKLNKETVLDMFKKKAVKFEKECKDNHDKLLRTLAEFDNYKKRSQKEFGDFKKYANETILKDLLQVVDNLERAVAAVKDHSESKESSGGLLEGVELTLKDLLKMLDKYGVSPVKALGEPFDPVYHQAVMQQESDEHEENTVITEYQKGYTLHDRLLRASMVVVAQAAQKKQD